MFNRTTLQSFIPLRRSLTAMGMLVLFSLGLGSTGTACRNGKAASGDTIVYITPTGKKYHRENCRYLKKDKTAISLGEAIRKGYGACKVCDPPRSTSGSN